MKRREFLKLSLAGVVASVPAAVFAQLPNDVVPKEFRIGYQKTGVLVITRQQGVLERRLGKLGIAVKWIEFTSGPPLLEAMNAGSVDLGAVGDSPPIFAQAAGAAIVYVAGAPVYNRHAILVQ